jgi:hypothetical protein
MAKTCEEIYVSRIENGIRAIRKGTKTPNEVNVHLWLNKLKNLNDGLYDDLLAKYVKVIKEYEKIFKKVV